MANEPQVKMSFLQIVKNPYTYLLVTVVSVMWFFIYSNKDITNKNNADCEREKTELRTELKQERAKNDNLINNILVKNGMIDKLTVITDSLNNKQDDKNH
jgi:hypothetical protein